MDCVILCAGRGSRLRGVVAEGMKPLVVVDGEALLTRLVRQARQAQARRIVLVVSPTNCAAIADVMAANDNHVSYVLQPEPLGPGDALRRGLEACDSENVLVLLGDNVIRDADVNAVANKPDGYALVVGVRNFMPNDVRLENLTRLNTDGTWIEKTPLTALETGVAWCGLLRVRRVNTRRAMSRFSTETELLIGPHLGDLGADEPYLVEVETVDIGVRDPS